MIENPCHQELEPVSLQELSVFAILMLKKAVHAIVCVKASGFFFYGVLPMHTCAVCIDFCSVLSVHTVHVHVGKNTTEKLLKLEFF